VAALLVVMAACGSDTAPSGPIGTPRGALLALPRTDTTPPPPRTILVRNDRLVTARMNFSDSAATLFAEFRFTAYSLISVNGQSVCDTCTVAVTITPLPGQFGFTVTPASLVFSAVGSPTVTMSYGRYADLSVYDSSARYPTAEAYSQALALWYEPAPNLWQEERNSAHTGAALVSSAVDAAVPHVLAALK